MCLKTGTVSLRFGYKLAILPSGVDKAGLALFLCPKLSTGDFGAGACHFKICNFVTSREVTGRCNAVTVKTLSYQNP